MAQEKITAPPLPMTPPAPPQTRDTTVNPIPTLAEAPTAAPPVAIDKPRAPRILDQPRDAWAVQLVAMASREALEAFASKFSLTDRAAAQLGSGDVVRYVLLWDIYRTRAEAVAAIAKLPPELKALKPFPRSIASVQDAMRDAVEIARQRHATDQAGSDRR